jgi:predicted Zn-dependent protease with MMP-like domain
MGARTASQHSLSGQPATGQDGTVDVSPERFAELVEAAYAAIPAELSAQLDNVALFIEDEPPADDPDLLGWYDGVALTDRDTGYGAVLPDRIVIYRSSTLGICDSEDAVVREVGITVAHEIAHHFGIDDDRLHALGYA